MSLFTISCSKKIPLVNNYDQLHTSPYGAYIEAKIQGVQEKLLIKGELIFADDKKIIIRTFDKPNKVNPYAIKDVLKYELYYAKNTKEGYDGWAVLNGLTTISHGFFLILTLPANLLGAAAVSTSKDAEFRYTEKELPKNQLYRFARYPKNLPPGISLSNLTDIIF